MSKLSESQMDKTVDSIRHMSLEELKWIQDEIVMRRTVLSRQSMREIRVGDNVEFTDKRGNTVSGTVEKKAIKYVTVDTGMGRWKVPASMLTIV